MLADAVKTQALLTEKYSMFAVLFRKFTSPTIAGGIATAMLLTVGLSDAHARRSKQQGDSRFDLRLRVAGIYGNQMYGTGIYKRQPDTTLTLMSSGMRAELEAWLPGSGLGLMAQGDLYNLAYKDKTNTNAEQSIHYGLGSLNVGWRIWGGAHAHASQTVISAGLAMALYPYINTLSSTHYERQLARLLGVRFGLRNRHAILSFLTFEWAAYYVLPQKLMSSGELSKSGTRALGGTALFDLRLGQGLSLGIGYTGGLSRLIYKPRGQADARYIDYNSNSGLLSLLFWL